MRNYLRIGTSSKTCRCFTELRNVFHALPFSDFLIISSFLTNHCVTALFNVCFSLLCHGLCFSWRIFCLWIAWKCYCRSFLWKNLAKKAKTTKMLFHKHKMSSLVTLSKEFEIQAQYLYCKWQLSSSGFCCQNKHVFSKHKQTSFFSCAVPIVPIGSPSECSRSTFLAHLHANIPMPSLSFDWWQYALIKKRPYSYEKAPCASWKLFQSLLPPELNVNRHRWLYSDIIS